MATLRITISALLFLIFPACTTPGQLRILGNDGEFIQYMGSIALSGIYFSDTSNIEIQDLLCFSPDRASQNRLPQDSTASPHHWLCFSNSEEAKKLFEPTSGTELESACHKGLATITIKNYRRFISESEGVSLAELSSIHHHGEASAVACQDVQEL